MKVRVKLGTVKFNDTIYKEGEAFELPEKEVDSLVAEGVVEVVKEEPKKEPEPKKVEEKEEPEEPKEEEEPVPEPTEEWTKKELVEFAGTKDIEVKLSMTKKEILEALKGGEESEHKTD